MNTQIYTDRLNTLNAKHVSLIDEIKQTIANIVKKHGNENNTTYTIVDNDGWFGCVVVFSSLWKVHTIIVDKETNKVTIDCDKAVKDGGVFISPLIDYNNCHEIKHNTDFWLQLLKYLIEWVKKYQS